MIPSAPGEKSLPDRSSLAPHTPRAMKRLAARAPLLAFAALIVVTAQVGAQPLDRWTADEREARASLPAPRGGGGISGALSCAAQRWTLTLETAQEALRAAYGAAATLMIDSRGFDVAFSADGNLLTARIPSEAIEPLKSGLRLEIRPGDAADPAVFSLRGSNVAITTAQERCSPRDMSAYQAVTFTPYSSHINLARQLRADDIEAFAASTASQPQVSAAMVELGEGRRLLFTRLCGSSWYYGLSGCNITGFAPEAGGDADGEQDETGQWQAVYDTENVLLHLERRSLSLGWPDLVTLPVRGAGTGLVWRWDGRAYALKGELPDEVEQAEPLPLRPTKD